MSPCKYFERQLEKARFNLTQQTSRNAPEDVLRNIRKKIGYYEAAVKALSVARGEWKEIADDYEICATEFECSNCKESFCTSELTDADFRRMMKFCPNCGAKMEDPDA